MKIQSIRWTVERAATEFGCARETLSGRLKRASIVAGADGKFSTKQICAAVHGDLESEKLRNLRDDAEIKEFELGRLKRELIPAVDVHATWAAIFIGLKTIVWNCDAPEADRRRWLGELRDLKVDDYFDTAKPVELEED